MRQLRNCFLIELYSSSLGVLGRPFGQPATQAHAATAATFSDTTTTSASPGAREGRGRREGETASAGRRQVRNSYVSIPLEELEGEGGRAEVVVAGTVTAARGGGCGYNNNYRRTARRTWLAGGLDGSLDRGAAGSITPEQKAPAPREWGPTGGDPGGREGGNGSLLLAAAAKRGLNVRGQ